MGRNPTGLRRPRTIEVSVSALEDEFISRDAHDRGISKSSYLRLGLLREYLGGQGSTAYMRMVIGLKRLRTLQKGIKGILRSETK